MTVLIAPNGCEINARPDAVEKLVSHGFKPVEPAPKPKAPRRKRTPKADTTEK